MREGEVRDPYGGCIDEYRRTARQIHRLPTKLKEKIINLIETN